ncbi:MAG TPA: hypothetical protein DC017_18085 [Candidatus Wallbacteria bacterium]|nr:hypothetical protein [Candidatus Wallbacteria bacterium]
MSVKMVKFNYNEWKVNVLTNAKYKVSVLASGSSGNCVYVETGGTRILIDTGISNRRIETGLRSIGVAPETIDAVFITHEHSDHISGLNVFQKKYHKKLYLTGGTLAGLRDGDAIRANCEIKIIPQYSRTVINGCLINTFMTDHDANEPFGVSAVSDDAKISLATDLGYVNKSVFDHLSGSNILIFESNYDDDMLINGIYPWYLKKRIMGKKGHLSNRDSAAALLSLNWDGLSHIYLAHLSRENNTHETVEETARNAFMRESHNPRLLLTWHDRPGECICAN